MWTLLPNSKASKANMIGCRSVCSLTPVSTFILALAAAGLFIIAVSL